MRVGVAVTWRLLGPFGGPGVGLRCGFDSVCSDRFWLPLTRGRALRTNYFTDVSASHSNSSGLGGRAVLVRCFGRGFNFRVISGRFSFSL